VYKNGQNNVFRPKWPYCAVIDHDGRPTIVDTLLTLIFKMGQGAFHFLFCLWRWPTLRLWQFATSRPPDYPKYTTNNRWRSVYAHFADGAGRVPHSVLPRKAANNPIVTVCNLSVVWLPRRHDQNSLMLCWHLFPRWGREPVVIIVANKGGQYIDYV